MKTYPRVCRNGHTVTGPADEKQGGCRVCYRARKRRYHTSPKGRAKKAELAAGWYERHTEEHLDRVRTYQASTQGMVTLVRRELRQAHQRLETL